MSKFERDRALVIRNRRLRVFQIKLTVAIKPEEGAWFYWTKVLIQYQEHYAIFERITTLPEYDPPAPNVHCSSGALMRLWLQMNRVPNRHVLSN